MIGTLNEHAPWINMYAKLKESHNNTKLFNSKTEKNRVLYVKQRNQSVSILRKTKEKYYSDLNGKKLKITGHTKSASFAK